MHLKKSLKWSNICLKSHNLEYAINGKKANLVFVYFFPRRSQQTPTYYYFKAKQIAFIDPKWMKNTKGKIFPMATTFVRGLTYFAHEHDLHIIRKCANFQHQGLIFAHPTLLPPKTANIYFSSIFNEVCTPQEELETSSRIDYVAKTRTKECVCLRQSQKLFRGLDFTIHR